MRFARKHIKNPACKRTSEFLEAVVLNPDNAAPSIESVQSALRGAGQTSETRSSVLRAMMLHCEDIRTELIALRNYVSNALELLMHKYKLHEQTERIRPGPVQESWLCDELVSQELRDKFMDEVKLLENVPKDQKDWDPDNTKQVLNLVDPSLYCCVFNETRGLVDRPAESEMNVTRLIMSDEGQEALVTNPYRSAESESDNYQWIPSEFHIDADTSEVRILSYINNLHPVAFAPLYDSISRIFKSFVPLFDRVMLDISRPCPYPTFDIPEMGWRRNKLPPSPEIPSSSSLYDAEPSRNASSFVTINGRTVQVIVKLSEIQLTPEHPKFKGGSWHTEGSDSEQIVATGLYFFRCDNISEAKIGLAHQ